MFDGDHSPLTSPVAYVGSCGGTRRGACNLKPSNERSNYNHALFRTTFTLAGMAALSRLPPVGLTMGLSPDTAHATDDIKKQLDYVDQDRGAQEAAAVRAGEVAQHSTRRSRRRCRLVSRLARTRRSNGRKSRGSPANMGGRQATKTPLIPSKRP